MANTQHQILNQARSLDLLSLLLTKSSSLCSACPLSGITLNYIFFLSQPLCLSAFSLSLSLSRMSDLYRHMRQQSRLGSVATPTADEDPAGGVWPSLAAGGRGKKGDILNLVCFELPIRLEMIEEPKLKFL